MSTQAQSAIVTLEQVPCCSCGIVFGLPSDFVTKRRADHKGFYCPNGHSLSYRGESEEEKFRKQLATETKRREWAEQDARLAKAATDRASRSAASYKGKLNHVKTRVAVGVCPCCRRNFGNLRRHMQTKHPNWNGDER